MELVKKDIEEALKLVRDTNGYIGDYGKYSSAFLFGTENQEGINRVVDYNDKDVFTVASSGDQYVGAVYYGAQKVDIYDVNRLTYSLSILKIVSIMTLDYKEFISFLVPNQGDDVGKKFWNLKTLKKVMSIMPSDVAYFWDNIMYECKKIGFDGSFVVPDHPHAYRENIEKGMPFYANEEEYYKLQRMLRNRPFPKFYEADVLSLGEIMCDKYDFIYLSNIIECLVCVELSCYPFSPGYGTEDRTEERYIFKMAKEVMPFLKDNGVILFDYRPNSSASSANDLLFQNNYFDVDEIECKYPPTDNYRRCDDTDLVLTYRPKKTGNILDLVK